MVQESRYRQYYAGGRWSDTDCLPQWSPGTVAILRTDWLRQGGDAYQALVAHLAAAEDEEPLYRQHFTGGTWTDLDRSPQWDDGTVAMLRFDALGLGDGAFQKILTDLR